MNDEEEDNEIGNDDKGNDGDAEDEEEDEEKEEEERIFGARGKRRLKPWRFLQKGVKEEEGVGKDLNLKRSPKSKTKGR